MINFSISWLNGISTLLLVLTAYIFAIYCLVYYIKLRVRTYIGGAILFAAIALGWTGITTSFLFTEFTSSNPLFIKEITRFFSYSTIPFGCFGIVYVVWELVGTKKSKTIVYLIYLGLFIAYYSFLYYNLVNNVAFFPAEPVGTSEVIDDWIKPSSLFFFFVWAVVIITSIITVIGFGKMHSKTTGELKERSSLLLIATPLIAFGILGDTVILGTIPIFFIPNHLVIIFLIRFIMIIGVFLIVIAFRPAKTWHILSVIPVLLIVFLVFYFFIGTA